MPQLDPSPWFLMFLSSWTLLLVLAPIKISKHLFPNNPLQKPMKSPLKSWLWPWP